VAELEAGAGRPLSAHVGRVLKKPQFWFGVAVLVPWAAWYILFLFRPIFMGLWMSFLRYRVLKPETSRFVRFDNFVNVFTYDRFWIALKNTVLYSVLSYAIRMPLALIVSWCLVSVKRGRRFYQFVVFLPVVVSLVAISMLFIMLMDPQFGVFNRILRSLGLPTSMWVSGSKSALISIVLVDVWKGLGFAVVLLSTAMLAVPQSLYDAATVDGVSGWQLFRHITLPLIANSIAMVSVLGVIGGLQVYVTPTVLGPGPGTSTLVVNQLIIDEAFSESWRFGFASAMSLVMFLLILALTVIQMRVLQARWEY